MKIPKRAADALHAAARKYNLPPSVVFECAVYNLPDRHLGVPEALADTEDIDVPPVAEAALRAMAPEFGFTAEGAAMIMDYMRAAQGERLWRDTNRG